MRAFDYSFLSEEKLKSGLNGVLSEIGGCRVSARLKLGSEPDYYDVLLRQARFCSIKASNRLEGIVLRDDRLCDICSCRCEPKDMNEAQVLGYSRAYDKVVSDYEKLDFCEETVLSLHGELMRGSQGAGKYKQKNNYIVSEEPGGKGCKIIFIPPSAAVADKMTRELISAYKKASEDSSIDPLALIACTVFDFLCIHPFLDGNGRMSRLLTVLLLLKSGYSVAKYISFEEMLLAHKSNYLEAMNGSCGGWDDGENDYYPVIRNFIYMMMFCYHELDTRAAALKRQSSHDCPEVESFLMSSDEVFTKSGILKRFPDADKNGVQQLLRRMLRNWDIVAVSEGREKSFIRAGAGKSGDSEYV